MLQRNVRFNDQSKQLIVKSVFNNKLWRSILEKTIHDIDIFNVGMQIISPFGFELLEDKRYLNKNLCRFYCYIGVPFNSQVDINIVSTKFGHALFEALEYIDRNFFNKIVLRIEQNNFIKLRSARYQCEHTDTLIDIQTRYINKTVLENYADYLICTLSAINNDKDESKEFIGNKRFRNRTYQLYVIIEKIFGSYVLSMTEYEFELYKTLFSRITNLVEVFYDNSKLFESADFIDLEIMKRLIKPRINAMIKAIQNGDNIIKIQSLSYHVEDKMEMYIDSKCYETAVAMIKRTYEIFI